ncbi:putative glycerol kinase 5 [Centruroides vittatus]|uniref:putative glycerol kinase 5 n=1 Tax=Centruroides vittatus TaxID=120091 RepID=UPI00351082C6
MDDTNEVKYIAAVDIGTSTIRCHIYDKKINVVGEATLQIELTHPHRGWVEVSPDHLWLAFVKVIKNSILNGKLKPYQIACLGISSQRGTFITWEKDTGRPFHNFISWKDLRASSICKEWNNSLRMKCLRWGSHILHLLSGKKRFLAAKVLKLSTAMVVMRLYWILQNIPDVKKKAIDGQALFGTIDTWLIWKLTGGRVHATDASNACITGLFDPFQMHWAGWAINMFGIPPSLLPIIKPTSGEFGKTEKSIFGVSIPITATVGDQQASMFGECCFDVGEIKCTMGTGSFININTGSNPHASYKGLYPVVGWTIGDETTYLAEGGTHDTGTVICWAQKLGLFDDPSESSEIATSIPDSGGVYFIPAFSGLQAPFNDNHAASAFIGLNAKTTKCHMVRAILEAIAFRIKQLYDIMEEEADFTLKNISVNGGVANNDFVIQLIADLTGRPIERSKHRDMSCLGVAFLAGLGCGIWKNKEELMRLRKKNQMFIPRDNWENYLRETFDCWERAARRCLRWYSDKNTV